jgi:hypothetical protein
MAWPNDIASNTPAKYLFKLVSETDECICSPEPLEWKAGSIEMKRDLESGGVMVSFLCDSLTFVGNGATFLRNLYNNKEVNAKCTLHIYWWKNFDQVTPANGRQYVEFPSQFDINFCFFETVKVGRFFYGVRVKAINSSTQTKLDNRIDVDVDISKVTGSKITTIGGTEIDSYGSDDNMLKRWIDFAATNIIYPAELNWNQIGHGVLLDRITGTASYTAMPLTKIDSDFTEIQSVGYQTKIVNIANITPFFKDALFDYVDTPLDIFYSIGIQVTQHDQHNWTVEIVETNPAGVIINTYVIGDAGGENRGYSWTDTVQVTCSKGNSLKLVTLNAGHDNSTAYVEWSNLKITQTVSQSPAMTGEGFPIYEAIERVCQQVLDVQYPIYSDFFGRTDVQYKPGVYYSAESVDRFAHVMGGMNLRGALLNNPDAPILLNFKNLMKSLKALWNVGYALEVNPTLFGDSNPRIRIEEYSHFFEATELVFTPTLASRITKYDIQSVVMPELIPVDIKSGFESFEYLTANGRAEPNTTTQRTSVMNTASKFEVISWLRGDTKGILDNISNPIGVNGSTDTKGDNSVFIIKSRKHPTSTVKWIPETDQSITVRNGSSLFKNDLLNRYFTPTRMLIRHANRFKAGMMKELTSVLKFQASDKSNQLETSTDGGVTSLFENQDLVISTLADPIFKSMKHTVIIPEWTFADQELIQLYPNKYLSFGIGLDGKEITGYLLPLKKKNAEDKIELTIIEKYVP